MVRNSSLNHESHDFMITADHFDVLERNAFPKKWSNVSNSDKLLVRNLVDSLNTLADVSSNGYPGTTKMAAFHTTFQLGGTIAKRLTVGCFPASAPHREYALSLRLTVSASGSRLSVALGTAMPLRGSDLDKTACEHFLFTSQKKLRTIPREVLADTNLIAALQSNMVRYSIAPVGDANFSQTPVQLKSLTSWLSHAGSPEGKGSTITIFHDRSRLDLPLNLTEYFRTFVTDFRCVIDSVYS